MYKTASISDIQFAIKVNNLKERSEKSLTKIINKLKALDELKQLKVEKRIQRNERACQLNPILYRAKSLYRGAKQRAKLKNIPFDLTVVWIYDKLLAGKCEVTGIEFVIKKYSSRLKNGYEKVHPFAPSLDQIKPSKGYTKDNVQVVCDQFNKFKNDRDIVHTYKIAKAYVESIKSKYSLQVKKLEFN
jgi:hypothetical protein